ncbi:MAG: tetratricopeptide repeat protein [Pseudomonadota bacterium]
MLRYAFFIALMPGLALACGPAADKTPELQSLVDAARAAPSEAAGRNVAGQMWTVLLRAPDAAAQEILDAGLARRDVFDFAGALAAFERLITYCPDYAEGYNQRAYVNFLRGNYEAALPDLDRALAREPLHVGAQSGRALTLMELGRRAEARDQMLAAVENNPWLSERALLMKGAPLGPLGTDL